MDEQPQPDTSQPVGSPTPPQPSPKKKILMITIPLLVLLIGAGLVVWLWQRHNQAGPNQEAAIIEQDAAQSGSAVDLTKLPLGDGKYVTDAPKQGYIFSCQSNYNGGGAFTAGPWIDEANKTWDLTAKVSVTGDVSWPEAAWSISSSDATRSLSGNNLPISHTTGTFPVPTTDEAYQYDRNPNSISAQSLSFSLPTNPSLLDTPQCVGGAVGIMLTGIPLFNGFDAGGRDAVAWETQDHCEGHPQEAGQYHYHGYSDCFTDNSAEGEHSALLGYAFDGFGIFGLKGENGQLLSSNDLDECHGHTHTVNWDGQQVEMYHYHFTYDFPYTVSCYRAASQQQGPLTVGQGSPPGLGPR